MISKILLYGKGLIPLGLVFAFCSCASKQESFKHDLTTAEKAYLSFPQYRLVSLSDKGDKIAVVTNFDNQSYIAIIDRVNRKILASVETGKDFNAKSLIWTPDGRLIVNASYEEGYLKGDYANNILFTFDVESSRLRKIYPPQANDPRFSRSNNYFSLISDELIDGRFLLVSEGTYGISRAKILIKKLDTMTGRTAPYESFFANNGRFWLDNNKIPRLFSEQNENEKLSVFAKNLSSDKWAKVKVHSWKTRSFSLIGFNQSNDLFYFMSDNQDGMNSLYSAKLTQQGQISEVKMIFSDKLSDIHQVAWDPQSFSPLYVESGWGKPARKYLSQSQYSKVHQELDKAFPGEIVYMKSREVQGERVLFLISDQRPVTYYSFDPDKKSVQELLSTNEEVRSLPKVATEDISYPTRDGDRVAGFLYRPRNWSVKTPLVINIHGGPFGVRDQWGYDGDVQFLVARGYSVLRINYRGSAGRGANFEKAGYKKLGTLMQDDIADAVLWATKTRIVEPGRTCLWGVSYGGYASVMSTLKYPDLIKCGVGFGGAYDWRTIVSQGDAAGNKFAEKYWAKRLPDGDEEKFRQSPMSLAGKANDNIYLMHGTEDVRCHVQQARDLRRAFEDAGRGFKYLEFANIGHWFVSEYPQKLKAYDEIAKFLDGQLKTSASVSKTAN